MARLSRILFVLVAIFCLGACEVSLSSPDNLDDNEALKCRSSAECAPGKFCVNGNCRSYCSADIDCGEGKICDLDSNSCIFNNADGDVEDGDVEDGDVGDGDVTDGDVTDGDVTDGDVTDGDVTDGDCDGCGPRRECDTDTATCVPDATHCLTTGCEAGTFCDEALGECIAIPNHCRNSGCDPGFICNYDNGQCEVDDERWPGLCDSCLTADECSEGQACLYNNETQEGYCSADCDPREDIACPTGMDCVMASAGRFICQPGAAGCGNSHNIGGSCTVDSDCADGGYCIPWGNNGYGYVWTNGYCSKLCESSDDCDNPYAVCYQLRDIDGNYTKPKTCLHICDGQTILCREGYICAGSSIGSMLCAPPEAAQGR